ncbi:MAG: ATP-binding cassette domain-containing protein, partial [Micromonosporaceae bacterium]|nr:ATP-binding cassette domain-containing protein [Micromonosporaceae bacterium]
NLDKVSKAYGHSQLLRQVSLGLDDRDRVGVVGLNGAGKTTLLRLLTRVEKPDEGRVTHRRDLRVRYLPQQIMLSPEATVGDVVLGSAWLGDHMGAEHEWASQSAVREVLDGLGMSGLGLDSPVGPMSGGERRRVALAALLVRPVDLLVLDEPTNHLDISGVNWLANWLRGNAKALVVVTHDRWFLDAVCTTTWEVGEESVRAYEGGYAAWTLARAERERQATEAEQRRRNLMRKELAWLRRGPPARTSKPKFRIEQANTLIADVPPPRDSLSLRRLATARLGKSVYDLEDVVADVPGRRILDGVTWRIGPGDRIGLLGANGAGKTTLLTLLAGTREPDDGAVRIGKTVRSAYLSQELAELPLELRVLEAVEEVARRFTLGDREMTAAQLAETFGFAQARLRTPVGDLSGGERRRLQLLRLLAGEPNVLLLDEPTNDFDTDTLAALEDLLDGWPGVLVAASHDRYLIERVCDTVAALPGDGTLVDLPGGVDEYLARPAPRLTAPGPTPPGDQGMVAARDGVSRQPGLDHAGDARSAGELRVVKKELARLERHVAKLQRREEELHQLLADHAADYEKVTTLNLELSEVRGERDTAEERWLTLAEETGTP